MIMTPVRLENESDATQYCREHDTDVRHWHYHMSGIARARLIREAFPNAIWHLGGPDTWSRDEQVNRLAEIKYPDISRAREIHYRQSMERHGYSSDG